MEMGKKITVCFLSVTPADCYWNLTWRLSKTILTRLCVVFVQYIIKHYVRSEPFSACRDIFDVSIYRMMKASLNITVTLWFGL